MIEGKSMMVEERMAEGGGSSRVCFGLWGQR